MNNVKIREFFHHAIAHDSWRVWRRPTQNRKRKSFNLLPLGKKVWTNCIWTSAYFSVLVIVHLNLQCCQLFLKFEKSASLGTKFHHKSHRYALGLSNVRLPWMFTVFLSFFFFDFLDPVKCVINVTSAGRKRFRLRKIQKHETSRPKIELVGKCLFLTISL